MESTMVRMKARSPPRVRCDYRHFPNELLQEGDKPFKGEPNNRPLMTLRMCP